MTTPLTSDQAVDLLRTNPAAYRTQDALRALAAEVDANSPGRVTVLYSGPVTGDFTSNDIIKAMREAGEDVRVINGSQAVKFLESDDFYNAVAKAYHVEKKDTVCADGVKSDGVSFTSFTAEQLQSFRDSSDALFRFKAPMVAHAHNPHERIFLAAFDGTGNDGDKNPEHANRDEASRADYAATHPAAVTATLHV